MEHKLTTIDRSTQPQRIPESRATKNLKIRPLIHQTQQNLQIQRKAITDPNPATKNLKTRPLI